ncbi:class I SAM-dependent methyltransferase [Paraclostridium bifermentans]|uniref:class I SAM-dependent methyltransferase n=1 Tax=Paraclostridium bifermentans TaxID=1490 RepID=UPI0029159EED|nr:class I SAM-dependent methyltransferase [Paraclostridium bifermentans]MDU3336916.1 class I SAM-dependent methyltransferase [Paraclostridium bifermentans]
MKENKYDDLKFFNKYSEMPRSKDGLESAGEWAILKEMLPKFNDKNVLDIGCGFGWHCRYASENGAKYVLGIDISKNMINRAKETTHQNNIEYKCIAMEDLDVKDKSFDLVISSLALHYVKDFEIICKKAYNILEKNGDFIFSVEHPIFTSNEKQDFEYTADNEITHWPIDNYLDESIRHTNFLGEDVVKYHRTVETYINTLIKNGFIINEISELLALNDMVDENPYLINELKRPMFLLISASKFR